MGIQTALDHRVSKDLMKSAEAKDGFVEKYRVEVREDTPPFGWAPYPEGKVDAYLVEHDGQEVFMFYNLLDDYARATVMTRDCFKEDIQFVAQVTPVADALRASAMEVAERDRKRQEAIDRENARQETERAKYLGIYSKLAAYLGQEPPVDVTHSVRYTAQKLLEMEALQNGKLNLRVLNIDFAKANQLSSQDINLKIVHALYKLKFKHDVEFSMLPDDRIEIAFKDLKGNVISKGKFGFFAEEDIAENPSGSWLKSTSYTVETIDIEDDEIAPEIIERGRPILLKDSRFRDAYVSLQEIEFVDHEFSDLRDGPVVDKTETARMAWFARNILEGNKHSARILNELTPKNRNVGTPTMGLG